MVIQVSSGRENCSGRIRTIESSRRAIAAWQTPMPAPDRINASCARLLSVRSVKASRRQPLNALPALRWSDVMLPRLMAGLRWWSANWRIRRSLLASRFIRPDRLDKGLRCLHLLVTLARCLSSIRSRLWRAIGVGYRDCVLSTNLTATDDGQHHIEHKIFDEMRRDIGQEVAKLHVKRSEDCTQNECRNYTA